MLSHGSIARPVEEVPETPFYIPGTGSSTRPRRTLKQGDCFAVFDSHADIGAAPGGPDGIFFCDTRYLSHLEMLLSGRQPLLLGSVVRDDNSFLTVDLTNPDIYLNQKLVQPKDMLHVVRTLFLLNGTVYQRLRLQNHGDHPFDVQLSFAFASDFADLFEVRGLRRKRRGTASAEVGKAEVALNYQGLDGNRRRTMILFEPVPERLSDSLAGYAFDLQPNETRSIYVTVNCDRGVEKRIAVPFRKGLRAAFHERQAASRGMATITSSNHIFNEMMCRSMADLAMLTTNTPQGPYPYAGIPWYSTTFGRDGIITALQMLWCDSRIAKGVLRRLAAFQATTFDPLVDAEPGKVPHEMRGGEMAALGEIPFGLYYGSVDATPLFVMLAGLYAEHTGDTETLRELWPNVEAALGWIDGLGDPDRDGFVEYHRADETGLVNQGWKDSQDAIFHADGSLAQGPIALCEVQGYVYAAKRLAARGAHRLGKHALGDALEAQAKKLAERFEVCILVRGHWHLCARSGWTEATVSRANLERRTGAIQRDRRARARGSGDARPDAAVVFFGMGNPHGGPRGAPLQSDVVSQWLGLAARQFTDRGRLCTLRTQERGGSRVQGPVRSSKLYGLAAPA